MGLKKRLQQPFVYVLNEPSYFNQLAHAKSDIYLFISAMQPAVIFFNRTTFFQLSEPMRLRMQDTECTGRVRQRGSPHSSPSSLLPIIWTCTTTRLPCSNTRITSWISDNSTAVHIPTGYLTSWTFLHGPYLLWEKKVIMNYHETEQKVWKLHLDQNQ